MKRMLVCALLCCLLFGCASTRLDFHHSHKGDNGYWMTVSSKKGSKKNRSKVVELFYCKAKEDGSSICKQTKVERCEGDAFQVKATSIDIGGEMSYEGSSNFAE